jgi:hypothetical protein
VLLLSDRVAIALPVGLTPVKDATLFEYDPGDASSELNSNGIGNFFSAGRTRNRSQIDRGLLQFDLTGLPAGAQVVPGSVNLRLSVVDVPRQDTTPRPFWIVRLDGGPAWGEGASFADVNVSGSGSGAPASDGDATWFHASYDSNLHDMTTFSPGDQGFWNDVGAIGGEILDPAAVFGPAAGTAGETEGDYNFTSASMESDLNLWLADPTQNYGWLVVGDEGVVGDSVSSKRDFASRENANSAFHPLLTFEYQIVAAVPEPGGLASAFLLGFMVLITGRRRR